MTARTASTALVGILLAAPVWAAPAHPRGINAREHRQTQRIAHGVRNGEITRAEGDRLVADEKGVRAEERVYRRTGGGLNTPEYKDLERDLNTTSREIARATHNDRQRGR